MALCGIKFQAPDTIDAMNNLAHWLISTQAWLAQEHGRPPSDPAPEWWSGDVESFLANKWPAIHKVEDESRKH